MGGAGAAARRERAFRPKLALGCQTTGRQGIQIRLLVCSSVARHSCRSRCFGQSKPSPIGGVKVCRTVLERRPAPERRARNDGTAVWQPPNEKWQRAERQLSFSVTGMKSSFHSRDCRLMGAGIGRSKRHRSWVNCCCFPPNGCCFVPPTGKPKGSLPITGETTLRVDSTQLRVSTPGRQGPSASCCCSR